MSQTRSSHLRVTLFGILALGAVRCAPMQTDRPTIVGEAPASLSTLFAPIPFTHATAEPRDVTSVALFDARSGGMSPAVVNGVSAMEATYARAAVVQRAEGAMSDGAVRVVRARVGAYKRIVTLDDDAPPLDARARILAREMNAALPRGTELIAVYDTSYSRDREQPQLVALQVGTGASAKRAFRVTDDDADVEGFYAPDGHPVEARFLRYPLDFVVVTSPFSHARRHPILKKRRPHLGVDLAAPYGTPVMAIADGDVVEASWNGNYGRTVGIRHDDQYATGYSHLDAIAPGIVAGAHVRKGEIVGFVGRSGLTTGPHLHFSMVRDGRLVDPLSTALPQGAALNRNRLTSLRTAAAQLAQTFARAEAASGGPTRVAARSRR